MQQTSAVADFLAFVTVLPLLLVPLVLIFAVWFRKRYVAGIIRLQAPATDQVSAPSVDRPIEPATNQDRDHPPPLILLQAASHAAPDPAVIPAMKLRHAVLRTQTVMGIAYWGWLLVPLYFHALFAYAADWDWSGMRLALSFVASVLVRELTSLPGPQRWLVVAMTLSLLSMPPLLAWSLQTGWRRRRFWLLLVGWLVAFFLGQLLLGTGWFEGFGFAIGALMLLGTSAMFLSPYVRGAGPPLLSAAIAGVLAALPLLALGVWLDSETSETWSEIISGVALLISSVVAAVWTGRRTLRRIARRYSQKSFSDQQLALAAFWGFVTVFMTAVAVKVSFETSFDQRLPLITVVAAALAWTGWRAALRWATAIATRRSGSGLSPLLLLRVFRPSHRAEEFMDRFLARWRFVAPVWLIAGPDLAGGFMEPDEFLAWLGRGMGARFVWDEAGVRARISTLDDERDADARFRVNETFCSHAAWQPAVLALIDRAGAVLLDLRGYTKANRGARFELVEVLRRADLERVILLTDERDDAPRLREEIRAAWIEGGGRSASSPTPTLTAVQVRKGTDKELFGLLQVVGRAAAFPPRPRSGADSARRAQDSELARDPRRGMGDAQIPGADVG